MLIVQSASKDQAFFALAMQKTINEIEINGMYQCDERGTVYVLRSQQYYIQNTYDQKSMQEYVISKEGPLKSHLYSYLKLALGLVSRPLITEQGKVYDILHQSDDHNDK